MNIFLVCVWIKQKNITKVVKIFQNLRDKIRDIDINISGNLSGTFNLLSDNFQNTKEGKNVACLYEDFTGDGRRDMFFGMQSGGLFYYINDSTVSSNATYDLTNVIDIYPNPSDDIINIKSEEDAIAKIYSIHGQLLINKKVSNNSQIDVSHLQPAYYIISFKTI